MKAMWDYYMSCTGLSYLVNVGVPHFGEEAESRWRVWVVDGELDPSLRATRHIYLHDVYRHISLPADKSRLHPLKLLLLWKTVPYSLIRSREPCCKRKGEVDSFTYRCSALVVPFEYRKPTRTYFCSKLVCRWDTVSRG